jgi:hypothetical protein
MEFDSDSTAVIEDGDELGYILYSADKNEPAVASTKHTKNVTGNAERCTATTTSILSMGPTLVQTQSCGFAGNVRLGSLERFPASRRQVTKVSC